MTRRRPASASSTASARLRPRPAAARAVIVGEPTDCDVADAHKSVVTFTTHVRGREAHSAKPYLGASAVMAACDLVAELDRLDAEMTRRGDPSGRFDPPGDDDPCRHHRRRHGAQHPGARLRLPLGVPRPARPRPERDPDPPGALRRGKCARPHAADGTPRRPSRPSATSRCPASCRGPARRQKPWR